MPSEQREPTSPPSAVADPAQLAARRAALLHFMLPARHPLGFGSLDSAGEIDTARPVELWITCRMTHVAALGALVADDAGPDVGVLRATALHGVRSLLGPLRDPVHDGWFAAVTPDREPDDAKQAYGHAFVVLAASSALAAGIEEARRLLDAALQVSLDRFWDEAEGLCREDWDRTWTTMPDYRGINSNMHTVEAYLAAGDVTGDLAWHRRAGRICARVAGWARANGWRVPEHFDGSWAPLLDFNADRPADPFRPYGATVGHGLEWARLMLATDAALGVAAPSGLREAASALYRRGVEDGWAADGATGFVYTTDWDGRPVVRARMHWVHCEAIAAAEALRKVTGESRYGEDRHRYWDFCTTYLIDPRDGSWRHELDPANRPASTVWTGRPDVYHAYQAALIEEVPLVPSFAAALAGGRHQGASAGTDGD